MPKNGFQRFNSTLVQLKGTKCGRLFTTFLCFNSTLVQLKGGYTKFVAEYGFKFQFYLSSIKRHHYPVPGMPSQTVSILP